MDFRKWQEDEKKKKKELNESLPIEQFFGRKDELAQLKEFIDDTSKKVFFLYGVPMIGKSTLVREFCKAIPDYKQVLIKLFNPENPETTIEKSLANLDINKGDKFFIVIENFEEALQWKGNLGHLHEIKFKKVRQFVGDISNLVGAKLLIESRFQIKNDFLPVSQVAELATKQLGKIDRYELFTALNDTYRQGSVLFDSFEQLCESLNDHIWLIELAMQNDWLYEDILEATQRPENLTQKLWEKVQAIIRKLPPQHRTLLCAFGIINPISVNDIQTNLIRLKEFEKREFLDSALMSLRKKLLLVYDARQEHYEINPFLREVCFTYLQGQNEMKTIEQLPFFRKAQMPNYNKVIQAQQKGDYGTFYGLIHNLRKDKKYDTVHEILHYVLETDIIINRNGVLNEIGITYRCQKNYPKAIKTLSEALVDEPKNVKVLNELAIVYKEKGDYPEAIATLEKACRLGNIHSFNVLAIIYKEKGDFPKAIETLKRALIIKPDDIKVLNDLAIVYKEIGDYENAREFANKGLSLDLNDPLLKHTLAEVIKEVEGMTYKVSKSVARKQKILFIAANPSNESRLQTDTEYRIIRAEIKRGSHRDSFEFLQPQLGVTITELLRALNEKPQIIHFSGHGDTNGIVITNDDNQSLLLPLPAMERLFKPMREITKIVVLNSCYSATQAKAISDYGMYTVGHNLPIGDKAAIDFAKGLYNGLSEGKGFDFAFNDAMTVVLTEAPNYSNVIEVWKDGIKLAL